MSLLISYCTGNNPAELFDYTVNLQQKKLQVNDSSLIEQDTITHELKVKKEKKNGKSRQSQNLKEILEVYKIKKRFLVKKGKCSEKLYLNVGKQKQSVEIKQKTVLKLGKSNVTVVKIKRNEQRIKKKLNVQEKVFGLNNFNQIKPENRIGQDYYSDSAYASTIQEAPCCRYCYQKSIQRQNLIAIFCKCEGTTKYVHQQCLRGWVCQKSKYTQVKPGIYKADKQGLRCEICTFEFEVQSILPCFTPNFKEYVTFLVHDPQNSYYYWIVGLNSNENMEIKFGRRFECHVPITDLSVSREHCKIKWLYLKGQLVIEDLNSKFGTLIQKQVIEVKGPVCLQMSRTRFLLTLNQQSSFFRSKLNSVINFVTKLKKTKNSGEIDQNTTKENDFQKI